MLVALRKCDAPDFHSDWYSANSPQLGNHEHARSPVVEIFLLHHPNWRINNVNSDVNKMLTGKQFRFQGLSQYNPDRSVPSEIHHSS